MKLSEAIRLGAMLRPQAFYGLFAGGGSCANGAALEAFGCKPTSEDPWEYMPSDLIEFSDSIARHPVTGYSDAINTVIVGLNNDWRWTRESIANWVATIEDAQEQQAQPQPAEAAQIG